MRRWMVILACLLMITCVQALTFPLADDQQIVGDIQTITVSAGQTITAIAQQYDVGYYELLEANQGKDLNHLEEGARLIIPTQYILPRSPHYGIVINLAEMRLYYYPADRREVITFPVGIGRQGWETPLGKSAVIEKRAHPAWHVPASIQRDLTWQGIHSPKVIPAGPQNPLGPYMMRLSLGSYLIHGSNDPATVGRRSSSGCIHLYNVDIKQLYQQVSLNTTVTIINQPNKLAWLGGRGYLESHAPIDRGIGQSVSDMTALVEKILAKTTGSTVNLDRVMTGVRAERGIPTSISE